MLHLGDITKINGAEAPVVDVVIGGKFVRWNRWFPADLGAVERTRNVPMGQRD